jgi:TPP-dependent pyruvate/acetoin dehydrogenase alpha subunit
MLKERKRVIYRYYSYIIQDVKEDEYRMKKDEEERESKDNIDKLKEQNQKDLKQRGLIQ